MKFRKYDKTWVDMDADFDFYGLLAEESGVPRRAAKLLFWNVVYHANDLRLGAAAQEVRIDEILPEDGAKYSLTGSYVRPIATHYIIERMRVLDKLGKINYEMSVDSRI
jgi:hypothetical protein